MPRGVAVCVSGVRLSGGFASRLGRGGVAGTDTRSLSVSHAGRQAWPLWPTPTERDRQGTARRSGTRIAGAGLDRPCPTPSVPFTRPASTVSSQPYRRASPPFEGVRPSLLCSTANRAAKCRHRSRRYREYRRGWCYCGKCSCSLAGSALSKTRIQLRATW